MMETEDGPVFCNMLIESVKKRLFPYEARSVTKLATLLDPRFKKEGFRSPDNACAGVALLEQDMYGILRRRQETEKTTEVQVQNHTSASEEKGSLFDFLEERNESKTKSLTADVIITKRQYLERANSGHDADPLLFWKVAI